MIAVLVFYSLGLLIPLAVGLREVVRPTKRLRSIPLRTVDLI